MDQWIQEIGDQPNLPEKNLLEQLWSGDDRKPETSEPQVISSGGKITIDCATKGASIGYKVIGKDGAEPEAWTVYQKSFEMKQGSKLLVQAHRIGFEPSEIVEIEITETN